MLIDSPRFKRGDRERWDELEKFDARIALSPKLAQMEERAVYVLSDFLKAGGYVSTSWGKDSTVLAHLLARTGLASPLVWVRVEPWDNPDCISVRDAFLSQYPHIVYDEIVIDGSSSTRWWDASVEKNRKLTASEGFRIAEKKYGGRHASGVRGEESKMRGMVMGRWGESGPHTARPIGRWTAVEVFAYLHKHDLPVHPAYAMSFAGKMDRRWLRVATIGGIRGSDRQRAEWETAYYPDIAGPNDSVRAQYQHKNKECSDEIRGQLRNEAQK